MVFEREQIDSGIVKTTIDGVMDLDMSLSSLNDLRNFVHENRLFEAVIHTENASIDVSYNEVGPLITKALEIFNNLDAGAIAFVTDDDTIFGLCRQLQMQLENDKVQVTVFRREQTAMNWLQEIKDSV